jgi:hypothetical protein
MSTAHSPLSLEQHLKKRGGFGYSDHPLFFSFSFFSNDELLRGAAARGAPM